MLFRSVRIIDLGTGVNRYKEELKSGDIFVGAGMVTTASPLAAVHRARTVGGRWMVETIKQNPRLLLAAGFLRKAYRSARNAHARSLAPRSA